MPCRKALKRRIDSDSASGKPSARPTRRRIIAPAASPIGDEFRFLRQPRALVALSVPRICVGWEPLLLMDLIVSVDQSLCFPIDRIPKMRRADYLVFAHEDLPDLNAIAKVQLLLLLLRA